MKHIILLIGLLIAGSATAQTSTLVGDTIDAAMIRTVNSGYGLGRITGYGLDNPFIVLDGIEDQRQYSSSFLLNVDGSQFDIRFLSTAGWQDGIVLRISDLDFSNGSFLAGVTVNTNLSNLSGYTLTTGTDWLEIGLGGTQFTPKTILAGSFNVTPVPESSSFVLLMMGLLAVAGYSRRVHLAPSRNA